MKKLKTLKTSWLLGAMLLAVVAAEYLFSVLTKFVSIPLSPAAIAALAVGAVAVAVSIIYDGDGR